MFDHILTKNFWLILFGTGAVVWGYYTFVLPKPCAAPITYKIGELDPRFGVSEAQFIDDINQASNMWGKAVGKKLFTYDSKGSLTINLIYDTRQKTTQEESKLKSNIDQTNQTADSTKQEYLSAKQKYIAADTAYTADLAEFNRLQEAYTAKVAYWNNKGGAPPDEFAALKDEKNSLLQKKNILETSRQELNQLAHDSNSLADSYNSLADKVNKTVQKFNNDGLAGTQFEEGVYISDSRGKRIDIYQFDNKITFIRVLAHELGHALGLAHNNDQRSIMNPVNEGSDLSVSLQDLGALKTECGVQ